MNKDLQFVTCAVFIGVGATLIDLWALVRRRFFGIPSLDLKLPGHWFGHMLRGRFVHDTIAKADPVRGEAIIGLATPYGIGCVFAALLLACGLDWAHRPTPIPPLIVGLGTVVGPFFLMQPCLGAGIAGSRTPNPNLTRIRSVLTHVVYGVGLYVSAPAWAALTG